VLGRFFVFAIVCTVLGGCSSGRHWVAGRGPLTPAGVFVSDFCSSIVSCVRIYDPEHINEVESGKSYDPSDQSAVIRCMERKGWLSLPNQMFFP
jgi:hypothetical protein